MNITIKEIKMNLFETKVIKTKNKLGAQKAFLKYIARDAVNKIYKGVSLKDGETIKNMLEKQDFADKLKKVGFNLSLDGSGWGFVAYEVDGKPWVDMAKFTNWKYKYGQLVEAEIITETIKEVKGHRFQEFLTFKLENNQVVRGSRLVDITSGADVELMADIVNENEYTYKTISEIPAIPMFNNSLEEPDIPHEVRPMLETWNYLWDQIEPEWEKVKAQFFNNVSFNSTKSAKDLEKDMVEDGKSFHDIKDIDGKVTNAIGPMTLTTGSLAQLEATASFIEGKVRLFSHQFREHAHGQSTSPNQTDIVLWNQSAFEYMMDKIDYLTRQLQKFMAILGRMTGRKTPTVEIVISEFEQFRIDILKAQRDLQVAQAEQAKGIAEKNKAEANSLKQAAKYKEEDRASGVEIEQPAPSPVVQPNETTPAQDEVEEVTQVEEA